ncbi:MAG: Gar1/Naf1 family protein [Candidatus Njordarchaeia archaeon]
MSISHRRVLKVGKILHHSPMAPNIVIAKVNSFLNEGTIVYDEKANRIGVILETFGPVISPYARIKLDDADSKVQEGSDIFAIEKELQPVNWKKKPKKRKRYRKR